MKNTLVIGASENPARYIYKAIHALLDHHYRVWGIGNKEGKVDNVAFSKARPPLKDVDTVTLYLNPTHQKEYYDYILSLKPNRIIFNPGTENPELEQLAKAQGVEPLEACTLVLLATGQY